MVRCPCNRDLIVFVCKTIKCKKHQFQPYYCMLCFEEEDTHDHKTTQIVNEVSLLSEAWSKLKSDITLTLLTAS